MKKIIILYIGILSVLMFTQFYNLERDLDMYRVSDFTATMSNQIDKDAIPIEIGGITSQSNLSIFIQQFGSYSEDNNIDFLISKFKITEDNTRIVDFYLWSSNIKLNDIFTLRDNKKIDFTSRTDSHYYTTSPSDENGYDLFETLDPSLLVDKKEIYQFIPYYQIENESYLDFKDLTVYLISNQPEKDFENIKNYFSKINSPFANNMEIFEMHATWQQIHDKELQETRILIPITLIVLLLILTTYTIKQNNKIMILRLHGFSTLKITNKLYLPLILSCVVSFLLVLSICYKIIIGEPSNVTMRLDQDLRLLILWFIISIISVYILILTYVKFVFNIKHLKRKPNFLNILKVNLLLKIIITIITISSFLQVTSTSIPMFNNYLTSLSMKSTIENTVVMTGMMSNSKTIFNELVKEGIYIETSYYSIFKEADSPYPDVHSFISANKNYLNAYDLKDSDGNPIDYSKLSSGDLLIPNNLQNIDGQPYCQFTTCDKIFIENNRTFKDYDISGPKIVNPVIIFVKDYRDGLMIDESSLYLPINDEKNTAYYENIIKEHSNEFTLQSSEPRVQQYFYDAHRSLVKFGSILFIYILLFFSFIYQSTFIFLDQSKKLIAIQYIQGISKKERYKNIYLNNSIVYIVPLLISILILKQPIISTLYYFISIVLLEIIVTSIMIYRFEKKSIASILKGEDDYE